MLSVLAACGGSIGSVEPPELASPPNEFIIPCDRPVLLPDQFLTQAEVEALWIRDRNYLVSCGLKLQALIDFYANRDNRITNK